MRTDKLVAKSSIQRCVYHIRYNKRLGVLIFQNGLKHHENKGNKRLVLGALITPMTTYQTMTTYRGGAKITQNV